MKDILVGGSEPPAVVYCLASSHSLGGKELINNWNHFERLQHWQLLVGSPLTTSSTGIVP